MEFPDKIQMISGPHAGNIYEKYLGEKKTISNPALYCVDIELIPGDYYRGIKLFARSPGTMSAKFLRDNPNIWIPA